MGGKQQRRRQFGPGFALGAAVILTGCLTPMAPQEEALNLMLPPAVAPPRGLEPIQPPPIVTRRDGIVPPASEEIP